MVAVGLTFLILLFCASIFFAGERGIRIREIGLIVLAVSTIIGLLRSAVVMWKTRSLDKSESGSQ